MQILIKIRLNPAELWPKQVLPKIAKMYERGRGTPLYTLIMYTGGTFIKKSRTFRQTLEFLEETCKLRLSFLNFKRLFTCQKSVVQKWQAPSKKGNFEAHLFWKINKKYSNFKRLFTCQKSVVQKRQAPSKKGHFEAHLFWKINQTYSNFQRLFTCQTSVVQKC